MKRKTIEAIKFILSFILFCIGISIIIFISYKISDKRIEDCISNGGKAVTNFYEMYDRCIY